MHEHFCLRVVTDDEAEALLYIEPLHGTLDTRTAGALPVSARRLDLARPRRLRRDNGV
jgi:hypothetical protein